MVSWHPLSRLLALLCCVLSRMSIGLYKLSCMSLQGMVNTVNPLHLANLAVFFYLTSKLKGL